MAIWQDSTGALFDDMGGAAILLPNWPQGMTQLTDEQVAAARAPTLLQAKGRQIQLLTGACQAAIAGGFTSAALGAPHTYPSQLTDQINLLGRVAQAQLDPSGTFYFWCADSTGSWAKRVHTAAQIIQAGQDGAAWVQTNSNKLNGADGVSGLLGQVNAASTVAQAQAVVWQ